MNGCVFLLSGMLILLFTPEVIKSMLIYFGMVVLATGILLLLAGINNIRRDKSGAMILVDAIVAIAAGTALAFFPGSSMEIFLIVTGLWVLIVGIIQMLILLSLKGRVPAKRVFLFSGLLTIGLGAVMLLNPFQWAIIFVKIIGVFASIFGILLVYFSLVLRNLKNEFPTGT